MTIDVCASIAQHIDICQYVAVSLDLLSCCPPLLGEPLSAPDADKLASILRVLGDPARLRLISLIAAHAGGEACVCELTEPLGLSQPTVSHHLKVLHGAGLVRREQRGIWAYYRLVTEQLEAVQTALALPHH
jgi:ArsR family transcriptional regulator, arsenate/arsenite/antimonite-responsive transcriptional repressor